MNNKVKYQRYTVFVLVLLICLLLSAVIPGTLTGEKEKKKEKKKQAQSTESTESKSRSQPQSGSEPESKSKQKIIIAGETKKYKGKPGTFIFHEADLKNVLLFFAKTYKLNMVIDPGISGKVTCRLVNVPWDQALDLILKQHGLAMSTKGNLITAQKLKK